MNPQPSRPTATNPMTAIAQIVDAPSESADTGFFCLEPGELG
jgi:hypothetical protein